MLPRWRKAMMATLVTAAALGLPGTAQAASPSVQIELCNLARNKAATVEITGANQHNTTVSSPSETIPGGECRVIRNWWWKTGETVVIAIRRGSLSTMPFDIPSNARNGFTQRIDVQ